MNDRTRRMVEMRKEGRTLQEIGDQFGLSRERVRQLVGPAPVAAEVCATCSGPLPAERDRRQMYCSPKCRNLANNLKAAKAKAKKCRLCGGLCMGDVCVTCQRATWEAERAENFSRLEELWKQGKSMADIAAEFDTTVNSIGGMMVRARDAGWDLPLRRARTPKSHNLTKAEARFQFSAALRKGTIRRPRRCEGCGEECFVEGHHTDYQRPLYVEWLCRNCHVRAHGKTPLLEAAA